MLHLGMLWPYMRILEKAGKGLASDNYSSLYGLSISDDEKKVFFITLTAGVNITKLFGFVIYAFAK